MNKKIEKLYSDKKVNSDLIHKEWKKHLAETVNKKELEDLKTFKHKNYHLTEDNFIQLVSNTMLNDLWEVENPNDDFLFAAREVLEDLTDEIISVESYDEHYITVGSYSTALYSEEDGALYFFSPDTSKTIEVNPEDYDDMDNALRHGIKQLKEECKGIYLGQVFSVDKYCSVYLDKDLTEYLNKLEDIEFSK